MIELYEWPPTRSQRAKWVLEELGLDYKSQLVDLNTDPGERVAYRALQPLGAVPALKSDGYAMFESVAIVLQLIDENPQKSLAPPVGSAERAAYYQWCIFACAELDPPIMKVFDNSMRPLTAMRPPGSQHDASLAERGRAEFAERAEVLSKVLDGQSYLVGDGFTGADLLIGHSCFMATVTDLIGPYPILEAYYGRLQGRPAFQRAYADFLTPPSSR